MASAPGSIRRLFPTASDIAAECHLDIQEAFQRRVDNAVSKTINLPENATPADIRRIYTSAWRRGLKGITVFREGCKSGALERGRSAPTGRDSRDPEGIALGGRASRPFDPDG